MKHFLSFLLLFVVINITAQEPELYLKTEGLSHPESVVKDVDRQVFYVSNMAGRTPGDGFISRVSPEGKVLELKWISELNDPKGLIVQGEKIYVTDNKELVEIDILSGEVLKKTEIAGAVGLNDIAAAQNGEIFISDTGKSSIYKLDPAGNIEEWLNSAQLERPNGLLVVDNDVYVAAWGKETPGNLLKVNRQTGDIKTISKKGIGNLDGIQRISEDSFYISDWATGNIFRINTAGEQKKILTSEKSAGDILFLNQKNELVLPMNHQNALWWYRL